MKRCEFQIEPEQLAKLQKLVTPRLPLAELIRRAIDEYLERQEKKEKR
jgi:hypothetical protein